MNPVSIEPYVEIREEREGMIIERDSNTPDRDHNVHIAGTIAEHEAAVVAALAELEATVRALEPEIGWKRMDAIFTGILAFETALRAAAAARSLEVARRLLDPEGRIRFLVAPPA
jgi:hypothetical protein